MIDNIATFDIEDDIIDIIDKNKFHIMKFNDFEETKISLKNIKVIIVDLEKKINFKELFKKIKKINNNIAILGLINFNRLRIATKLLKESLTDYIIKNNENQLKQINSKLEQIINSDDKKLLKMENISMLELVNSNAKMKKTINNIVQIADANVPILIQGEQGCEHELYAKIIHKMSNRKDSAFLNVFCPSITRDNLEKVLYGDKEMIGKLDRAANGTIFLENIDCLDYTVQSILTRILEKREVDGIGGTNKTFNLRMIASSNKDLELEAKSGRFKEELYFLINGYTLNIPPLRETRNIIPLLVKNLYKYYSDENNKCITGITSKALKILENYDWPGNIKEIKSVIQRAVILNTNGILDEKDFVALKVKNKTNNTIIDIVDNENYTINFLNSYGKFKTMEALEREIVDKYLKINNGNITEAAKILNIGRTTLYRKIEETNE